jgi:hypothetical protein
LLRAKGLALIVIFRFLSHPFPEPASSRSSGFVDSEYLNPIAKLQLMSYNSKFGLFSEIEILVFSKS